MYHALVIPKEGTASISADFCLAYTNVPRTRGIVFVMWYGTCLAFSVLQAP